MDELSRQQMISHQRAKAHHVLMQADEMIELHHWDLAVNRYYYACFHILQALLIANGLSAHTHSGLATVFGQNFVNRGLIDLSFGRFFSRMVQLRQKADYNSVANISEQEAKEIVEMSKMFVLKIGELIPQ